MELGNDLLYPWSGTPHGDASADACIYWEPAAYCKGLPLSSHKQALLAVLEIAIIAMVRVAQTEGRIMTSRIKG